MPSADVTAAMRAARSRAAILCGSDSCRAMAPASTARAARSAASRRADTARLRLLPAAQLSTTALRTLALFAGAEAAGAKGKANDGQPLAGLQAISDFIENSVPQDERSRISDVLLRVLNGSLFQLLNLTRENAGLQSLPADQKTQAFMTQSVLSLSDSFFYPAPVLFELTGFKQVQASVFQVTRAPGKTLVYLGAVLLIIGVFAMLYIRERRLWIWIASADAATSGGGSKVTVAMSTTRRTLDADTEFEQLKRSILKGSP